MDNYKGLLINKKFDVIYDEAKKLLETDDNNAELWYLLFLSQNNNYIGFDLKNVNNIMAFNRAVECANINQKLQYSLEYQLYSNLLNLPGFDLLFRNYQFNNFKTCKKILTELLDGFYVNVKISDDMLESIDYVFSSVYSITQVQIKIATLNLLYNISSNEKILKMLDSFLASNTVEMLIPEEYQITDNNNVIKYFLEKIYEEEKDEVQIENEQSIYEFDGGFVNQENNPLEDIERYFVIDGKKLKQYIGPFEDVVIPEGVFDDISTGAFKNTYVVNVVIPKGIKAIRNRCFEGCTELKTVIMSNDVKSIGFGAFSGCTNLKYIKLSSNIKTIGDYAFSRCKNLADISFPECLTSIGDYAFLRCASLDRLIIPKNVSSIYNTTFRDCTNVSEVIVYENNPYYDSRDKCNAIIEKESGRLIFGCKNCFIPEGVKILDEYAFACIDKFDVVIPSSVTKIYADAFYECDDINSIVVDPKNTVYDSRDDCNAIIEKETNNLILGCNKTIIPYTVTSIDTHSFFKCNTLQKIIIPPSVKFINQNAFEFCERLYEIIIYCRKKHYDNIKEELNENFYDKSTCPNAFVELKYVS
ncbi:MAG: leucine-rich repeat domain-containing protein [Acholeplasmatales bacterium]|nr:leucine-rich repeat domain-containing protein [Acholeplasmatales bacterium]